MAPNYSTPSDSRSPSQTTLLCLRAGEAKYKDSQILQFIKAVMGGIFLSLGCTVTLSAGASQGLQTTDGGLGRVVGAAFGIPFGLIMIVLGGMELVTSTMMTVTMSTIMRRTPIWFLPWSILNQFFGNLVGALMYTAIVLHWSGVLEPGYYGTWVQTFVNTKVVTPTATEVFLRGIGCNFLVCVAVWQGAQARETVSKILAIWFPIFLFVASAFDHVVANMCLITIGLFQNDPSVSTAQYIRKSMLPSLAGNYIASSGACCLGLPYTLIYLSRWAGPNTAAGIMSDAEADEQTASQTTAVNGANGMSDPEAQQVNHSESHYPKGLPSFFHKKQQS